MRLRDLCALLLAGSAAVAGAVVWNHGTVNLGLELADENGEVRVFDVTPGGNAAQQGWMPGVRVLDLTTVDGGDVARGEPLGIEGVLLDAYGGRAPGPWGAVIGPSGGEITEIGPDLRPPVAAVESARIRTALAGEVNPDFPEEVYLFASLDRTFLELELRSSIWLMVLGMAIGAGVWRLLVHGIAGATGRGHTVILGCAVAVPFLVVPAVEAGTPLGIATGYLGPATVALLLGLSLAREHPDRAWAQTAAAGSALAAGLAVALVVRYLTASNLGATYYGSIVPMVAAIPLVPAIVAATAEGQQPRQRLRLVSMSLVPAAAHTLIGPYGPDPQLPILFIGALMALQLVPLERTSAIGDRVASLAGGLPTSAPVVPGAPARARDAFALFLFGAVVLAALLASYDTLPAILALALAALVGYGVRRGFLGPAWTDLAVPLAVAVGTPMALSAVGYSFDSGSGLLVVFLTSLAALAVAHALAGRHPLRAGALRLFLTAAGVVALIGLLVITNVPVLAVPLVAIVALIPGIPIAFAAPVTQDARAVSSRMETLAVALTPAAAALALLPGGIVLLLAWLVGLVVWRYGTLRPMLRFVQRTQLQRDVAVAAAETERARLAADLHDDALQQVTMLVRTLDERGDKAGADEAREIAAKLRGVVGDLRLPILDDLGAGAALEWLVERVEPLAGGAVKLERSDETRPPATVELAVFRVAQEALTNAIKHGRPPIAVRYDVRSDGRVTLAIDDAGDGIGADAEREATRDGHFGLLNMQQRAEQIGALLDVRRWPGGGTRVALEWRPL